MTESTEKSKINNHTSDKIVINSYPPCSCGGTLIPFTYTEKENIYSKTEYYGGEDKYEVATLLSWRCNKCKKEIGKDSLDEDNKIYIGEIISIETKRSIEYAGLFKYINKFWYHIVTIKSENGDYYSGDCYIENLKIGDNVSFKKKKDGIKIFNIINKK